MTRANRPQSRTALQRQNALLQMLIGATDDRFDALTPADCARFSGVPEPQAQAMLEGERMRRRAR